MAIDLSVVIPCYNEVESLPHLVAALAAVIAELEAEGLHTEVIVVDDGSTDGSFAQLTRAQAEHPWLVALELMRNYGQTAALQAGFDHARGEIIVPMDADLQNDPRDIPLLLARLDEGYDVVCGWRRDRKDELLRRKLPSRIANMIIGRVSGLRLHDYGCTLKAFRAPFLRDIRLYGEMHRFLPIYAQWEGARTVEIPVRHHPRAHGTSKYGLGRTLKVILDLITVKLLSDYSTKPLYFFGRLGLVCGLMGIVCAAASVIEKFAIGTWIHKNPLALVAVLLAVVGTQLIGMGLLAELQVRTYHESQAKPTYRLRERLLPGRDRSAPASSLASSRGGPPAS